MEISCNSKGCKWHMWYHVTQKGFGVTSGHGISLHCGQEKGPFASYLVFSEKEDRKDPMSQMRVK